MSTSRDLPIAFTVWEPFRLAAAALDVSTTLDSGANENCRPCPADCGPCR